MESDLGAKVKKLRISHGLTQEDVAKALDVLLDTSAMLKMEETL